MLCFLLGLSLTALSPAAAWYFVFIVCHFLPLRGQKMTHKGLILTDKRQILSLYCAAPRRSPFQRQRAPRCPGCREGTRRRAGRGRWRRCARSRRDRSDPSGALFISYAAHRPHPAAARLAPAAAACRHTGQAGKAPAPCLLCNPNSRCTANTSRKQRRGPRVIALTMQRQSPCSTVPIATPCLSQLAVHRQRLRHTPPARDHRRPATVLFPKSD